MRVYLDEIKCQKAGIALPRDKENPRVFGHYLGFEGDRPYIDIGAGGHFGNFSGGDLKPEILKVALHFTEHDNFYKIGRRKLGKYRHRSATMEVSWCDHLHVRMRFDSVEDGRVLRDKFAAGTILPEVSYEEPQIKLDSVRSLLKLVVDILFRRFDDYCYRTRL